MARLTARRYVGWLLAGSAGLAACSGAHEPTQTATAARADAAIKANVPALVGLSIDGLHRRLGPSQPLPAGFTDPRVLSGSDTRPTAPDSVASFQTGGITLIASFDAHTRQVRDLLLLGPHEDSLMAQAALRSNASDYLVLPVFYPQHPNRLLGLRVVAINVNQ